MDQIPSGPAMPTDRKGVARFVPNTAKALECVLWLANQAPAIDIYHVVNAMFFADVEHLNKHGRAILGDDYEADRYGPLGRMVYGLLRDDRMERLALGANGPLPFTVDASRNWSVVPDRQANERLLSQSDVAALATALNHVRDMSFDDLVEKTHAHPAYRRAMGKRMRYEDLLDRTDPRYAERVEDLRDNAATMVL